MTISCREGLNLPSAVMEQIIVGANQDIRQVLHNLQMWSATKKTMTFDEAKSEAKNAEKNIKIVSKTINHDLLAKMSHHCSWTILDT